MHMRAGGTGSYPPGVPVHALELSLKRVVEQLVPMQPEERE